MDVTFNAPVTSNAPAFRAPESDGNAVPLRSRIACLLAAVVLPWLTFADPRYLRNIPARLATWSLVSDNEQQRAYNYLLNHRDDAFFPFNPLPTLMATGRVDHFEPALRDLRLAGMDLTPSQLPQGLPPHMQRIIQRTNLEWSIPALLPEFNQKADVPELPGWNMLIRSAPQP